MTEQSHVAADKLAAQALSTLYLQWENLRDIPVFEESTDTHVPGSIEEPFLDFSVGTPKEEIWRWFERQNKNFIIGEVQQGIRRVELDSATE